MPQLKCFKTIGLQNFCDSRSLNFFKILKLDYEWLLKPPGTWKTINGYLKALSIVKHLKSTNDDAERGCYYMAKFNQTVTEDWTEYENLCTNFYSKNKK